MINLTVISLVVAIVLTVMFVYYYKILQSDTFTNCNSIQSPVFLQDNEIRAFLRNDKDHYVQNMSTADLRARKAKTSLEYINRISQCNKNDVVLDPHDIQLMLKCALKADKFLEKYTYKSVLQGKDISKYPWKFAIVCTDYEGGFPHTREDIIFLTRQHLKVNEETLTSLLIHEKVHIFQRYNPQLMNWYLEAAGYVIVAHRNDPKYKGLVRSNPDINNYTYSFDGKELVFLYRSNTPSGINDVFDANGVEHPYEKMAYDIGNDYLREEMKKVIANI